jgi:GTP-binding protein
MSDDIKTDRERIFNGQHEFMLGVAELRQLPDTDLAEIAFAGRSNVGKSSLINAVTGRRVLARTSKTPGRTQELNFFSIGPDAFILVDMPGYGYAKVSKTKIAAWTKTLKKYLKGRVNIRLACVLVDGRHGLKTNDIEMMEMLDEAAVPYRIVLTKADKVKKDEMAKRLEKTNAILKKHPAAFPEALVTSSEKKIGISELQDVILAAC